MEYAKECFQIASSSSFSSGIMSFSSRAPLNQARETTGIPYMMWLLFITKILVLFSFHFFSLMNRFESFHKKNINTEVNPPLLLKIVTKHLFVSLRRETEYMFFNICSFSIPLILILLKIMRLG